jgi:hypothetical protein
MADIEAMRAYGASEPTGGGAGGGWTGWIYFAAAMMIMVGIFHAIAGLVAILDDEFYVQTREYVFQFDATQWGWIHLILGILVAVAGGYLVTGSVIARTVGVIMAALSAISAFGWLPHYPVWGAIIIAIALIVIWALTVHGRDVVAE